jgi:tRNA pseudouridine55 synthase
MNGLLVVDKPAGPTSHDVVGRVRRAIGVRRIGHTGTLDPLATGVLPLVIGRATRLAQFLVSDEKAYEADIRFGRSTPTYDSASLDPAAAVPAVAIDPARLLAALEEFRGTFLQQPPPFSAKKIEGTRAYALARRGEDVELRAVPVSVHRLAILASSPGSARLEIVCSSGFYVRTLAHDVGARLGCGAYLERLRRTRAGAFGLEDAVTLERIEAEGPDAVRHVIGLERLLPSLPPVVLTQAGVRRATHGNSVGPGDLAGAPPAAEIPGRVRLLDPAGTLLAIAEPEPGGFLHPVVVLV